MHRGLSVPVPERSGARHVIIAHGPATLRPFTIDDARFLEAVAHVIAGALDRAATEDELRRRALEDPLTGLANRALLASQLDAELRHARRLGDRVCVLVLDLDRFKVVNDTLGHSAGDTLLRKLAARLSGLRTGGGSRRAPGRRRVHRRLHPHGDRPRDRRGRRSDWSTLSSSRSRSTAARCSSPPASAWPSASTAAKRPRSCCATRTPRCTAPRSSAAGALRSSTSHCATTWSQRMTIEGDLRHAVERDQLELHYQPLIDLADERVVGFEALLRWRHPERGLIAPDQFIPIAEETGLIVPIGSWVLHAGLHTARALARGDPTLGQPLRAADHARARHSKSSSSSPSTASRPIG